MTVTELMTSKLWQNIRHTNRINYHYPINSSRVNYEDADMLKVFWRLAVTNSNYATTEL